ncbi:MAG: hypothetical protein A3H98_02355 [Bacteroidetes bacterium RIFCSPLOWO2_02_FULL_36_8]|nr:MAG: hypothetical protein A3H98_02355 [Bacteroidetes bacterium RIFCSPLOWO2_02_FULL_36_8]OFY69167.1 MAG: hypothetical protein A3G23_06365 [Bacteroidetes bacterium RIFCSPLOWO2_12_FULL_37_12]
MKSETKKELLNTVQEFMNSDIYKEQEKLLEERSKTLKSGADVIHLTYLGHQLEDSDLKEIEEILKKENLQLSSYNKSGIIYNLIDDYTLTTFFVISYQIYQLLNEVKSNALWDILKYVILKTWNKINTRTHIANEKIKFGITVNLDEKTRINVQIEGSEKLASETLDKVLTYLKTQERNTDKKMFPDYINYDEKKGAFVKIDVANKIRKKANRNS